MHRSSEWREKGKYLFYPLFKTYIAYLIRYADAAVLVQTVIWVQIFV